MQSWVFSRFMLCIALLSISATYAADANLSRFTVLNIRVEGLERVSEGTVFNYLPISPGDELNPRRVREALRALFATGLFREVELRRDGDTLVVDVRERPSIDSFEIQGNKDIKTEELTKSLRGVGLAAGKTFDRSVLEEVKSYLTDQYFSRGKYGVQIDTTVDELPGNRVNLLIDIKEGERARLRQITIIGNTRFKEKDILATFELQTPKWNSWYKQNDRYAREAMQGDLEKLTTWYQDRGYANFEIESVQVTISPEKDDMFVTISIKEGEVYKIADARIAGNTIVPARELQALVQVQKGQTYSQQRIAVTQKLIENRLGLDGYAFAKVDPITRTDDESKEAVVTFLVDPGNRVYVRHINFLGVTRTNDVVLRREMRQLEGAWVSNIALERSKLRLQQLPYIEKVDYEKKKVEGSNDLIDVDVTIKEGPSSQLSGGLGYSESSSFILNASLIDANLFGTGQRVAAEINGGRYAQIYGFSHTKPYITIDGVSRTTNLSYSRQTQLTSSYSDFSTATWLAGLEYAWPITEEQVFSLGATLQRVQLTTTQDSSDQLWEWVRNNGGLTYLRRAGDTHVRVSISDLLEITSSWRMETRDNTRFPTSGRWVSASASATVPGSGLEYITATVSLEQYFRVPLPGLRDVPFRITSTLGYGTGYGDTDALPPNRHWFVGGIGSVRGFNESTLGPRDSIGNPFGGDAALYGAAEAILPIPRKWQSSARASVFYDFGQAFYLGNNTFLDKTGVRTDTGFGLKRLRTSTGLSIGWLSPMGMFKFSYAIPLNWQKETNKLYGDNLERFQFSIVNAF
jgi:outer membrane protein insertion porin family